MQENAGCTKTFPQNICCNQEHLVGWSIYLDKLINLGIPCFLQWSSSDINDCHS